MRGAIGESIKIDSPQGVSTFRDRRLGKGLLDHAVNPDVEHVRKW